MGCDIHLRIERQVDDRWEQVIADPCCRCNGEGIRRGTRTDGTSWEFDCYLCDDTGKGPDGWYHDRNYDVFAILANVRNGHDVTGTKSSDGLKFISDCRGIPEDVSPEVGEWMRDGDHSHTWVLLSEVLSVDWSQVIVKHGSVSLEEYRDWWLTRNKMGEPKNWGLGRMGPGTKYIENAEMEKLIAGGRRESDWNHKQVPGASTDDQQHNTWIVWEEPYAISCGDFLTFVKKFLVPLGDPTKVRLCMWFDS